MPYIKVETTCLETQATEEGEYYYFDKPMRRGFEIQELADDIVLDCFRLAYPEYMEGKVKYVVKR